MRPNNSCYDALSRVNRQVVTIYQVPGIRHCTTTTTTSAVVDAKECASPAHKLPYRDVKNRAEPSTRPWPLRVSLSMLLAISDGGDEPRRGCDERLFADYWRFSSCRFYYFSLNQIKTGAAPFPRIRGVKTFSHFFHRLGKYDNVLKAPITEYPCMKNRAR